MEKSIFSVLLLSLIISFVSFSARGVVEETEDGAYNWEKSVVVAEGYGFAGENIRNETRARLLARESAISMAQRRLIEIIDGARIDSEKTVKNAQLESDVVVTKVNGLIRGARIIEEEPLPDNGYKVVMEVQFYGRDGIMEAIFPTLEDGRSSSHYQANQPRTDFDGSAYTGLIINAVEIGLEPALAPAIYTPDEELVYGIDRIEKDEVISNGLVGYNRTIADARNQTRVGNNPLVIDVLEIRGDYKTDLVITKEDAAKIDSLGETVFSQLAVVIVL